MAEILKERSRAVFNSFIEMIFWYPFILMTKYN